MGYLYMFDMHTGAALYRARISQDTIFSTVPTSNGAILGLTARKGQLLSVSMNKDNIIPYIINTLQNNDLALKLSSRLSLPGAEGLVKLELEKLLASGDITGAAKLAGSSGNALRTPEIIARLAPIKPVAPIFERFEGSPDSLEGITIVITGELASMTR